MLDWIDALDIKSNSLLESVCSTPSSCLKLSGMSFDGNYYLSKTDINEIKWPNQSNVEGNS